MIWLFFFLFVWGNLELTLNRLHFCVLDCSILFVMFVFLLVSFRLFLHTREREEGEIIMIIISEISGVWWVIQKKKNEQIYPKKTLKTNLKLKMKQKKLEKKYERNEEIMKHSRENKRKNNNIKLNLCLVAHLLAVILF